jgi:hypothetical protein
LVTVEGLEWETASEAVMEWALDLQVSTPVWAWLATGRSL